MKKEEQSRCVVITKGVDKLSWPVARLWVRSAQSFKMLVHSHLGVLLPVCGLS